MKKNRNFSKFFLVCITILLLQSCSKEIDESDIKANDIVYVCMGAMSKAYHVKKNCTGLRRCSKEIIEVSKSEAEKMNRHFCSFCKGGG